MVERYLILFPDRILYKYTKFGLNFGKKLLKEPEVKHFSPIKGGHQRLSLTKYPIE